MVHLAYQHKYSKMLPTSLVCFLFWSFNLYLLSAIATLLGLSGNWFLFYFVFSTIDITLFFFSLACSPRVVLNNNTKISTAKWFFVALHAVFAAVDDGRMNEKNLRAVCRRLSNE